MSPPPISGGVLETTYHRKLRGSLLEIRTCCRNWEDLIDHDGFRAIQRLVDGRTDLECVKGLQIAREVSLKIV